MKKNLVLDAAALLSIVAAGAIGFAGALGCCQPSQGQNTNVNNGPTVAQCPSGYHQGQSSNGTPVCLQNSTGGGSGGGTSGTTGTQAQSLGISQQTNNSGNH